MREFKKKIMAALAAAALAAGNVSATGLPVLDISNLMNGIMQLYQMYEEISNVVTQVQNTYKQIEQAVNQVKTFDWSNVGNAAKKYAKSWSDLSDMSAWEILTNKEKVLATKSMLQNLNSEFSSSINVYTNVLHKLDESTVTINGNKFSPLGLFGVGKHGDGGTAKDAMWNIADAFAKNNQKMVDNFKQKTPEEQEKIYRKAGFHGDGAVAIAAMDDTLDGRRNRILANASDLGKQLKRNLGGMVASAVTAGEEEAGSSESENMIGESEILATQANGLKLDDIGETLVESLGYQMEKDIREETIEKAKIEEEIEKEKQKTIDQRKSDTTNQKIANDL